MTGAQVAVTLSVQSDIDRAVAFLDDVHKRHVPFATMYALSLTARDEVKPAEKALMERVFDRPTPYTMNALQTKPATSKKNPVAEVVFKEFGGKGVPAKRFLMPHVIGGGRSQKSHERQIALLLGSTYLIPGKDVAVNKYGNVPGSTFTRILSQLKLSGDPMQNASGSRRSKAKRKNDAYFVSPKGGKILHRKGDKVSVALLATKPPTYRKRFPFYETAEQVVERTFPKHFEIALDRAIATSNYKGKWKR